MNAKQRIAPQTNPVAVVDIARGAYGSHQPEIRLQLPRGTHYRQVRAALHRVAAAVEAATPPSEGWNVNVDDERGAVFLELLDATRSEAVRGLALLCKVAATEPWEPRAGEPAARG